MDIQLLSRLNCLGFLLCQLICKIGNIYLVKTDFCFFAEKLRVTFHHMQLKVDQMSHSKNLVKNVHTLQREVGVSDIGGLDFN